MNKSKCEIKIHSPELTEQMEPKYTNHSIKFKTELRQIVKKWNKFKHPELTKVKAKAIETLPCIEVQTYKNRLIDALLDTGASKNFICEDIYNEMVNSNVIKPGEKWSGSIIAANDSEIEIKCECKMKVKIGKYSWYEKFLVIKQNSYSMILGSPFIRKTGLIIDLSLNNCYFKFDPLVKIKLTSNLKIGNFVNNLKIGTPDMAEEIEKLIKSYPDVFTNKIGEALDLEVELKLTDNKPVNIRPYYLSPPAVQKMKKIIDEWLEQDIIEPSTSEYSSPAFLTPKDRLVVNYSELNKKLVKMNYPLGDLQNMYQHLQGAKYFTVIDLNKAFLQCQLAENSRDMTSFSTIFGKYRMKRVCFGLQVGSSVLSSYLDRIFKEIKFKYLINFCDDIVIYSPDRKSHLEHVKHVVQLLSDYKLTANIEKARFFCTEISFLGHLIKENTITIDPERTASIRNFPVPKTVKQVRQFTGMCSYWLRYIPNYAEICAPLHQLKRKGVKFKWSEQCQKSFEKLKEIISNPPVLHLADFTKPFVVQTDASTVGAGGILLQYNDNQDLMPIAYYSKKFNEAELKYSIYEKEAYSAILCIEKWHEYLEVQPFTLVTDNQALSYVLNTKRKLGRLSRWVERLLNLPFTVQHRRGSENILADTLSRLFEENIGDEENKTLEATSSTLNSIKKNIVVKLASEKLNLNMSNVNSVNNRLSFGNEKKENFNLINEIPLAFTDIKTYQAEDIKCKNIIKSIREDTNQLCYFLKNDILMYKNSKGKARIYLPDKLINLVFTFYHNTIFGGHLGISRTQNKINEYFYNPELDKIVKEKVKQCQICSMSKTSQQKYEGKLISVPIEECLNTVFVDILGPLPRSKSGNRYLLVILDGFSRFLWLYALRDCNSRIIIDKLQGVFNNFSTPRILVSDNASYFVSKEFKSYLFKNFIQHRRIAAYRANGNRAERYIRDISTLLRCFYHEDQINWDQDLGHVQMSLNTAKNSSLGTTPFQIMFNHPCHSALSNIWNIYDFISSKKTPEEKSENLKRAINNIKRSIARNRRREKYQYPRNTHPFKINQIVFMKTHYLSSKINKFSKKLALKYAGPYRILYFITPVTVLLQNVNNLEDVRKVHVIDLKLDNGRK
jgi:hypothetical protein